MGFSVFHTKDLPPDQKTDMKKSLTLFLLIVLLIFASAYGCGKKDDNQAAGSKIPSKNLRAVDFTLQDMKGVKVSLSDYRGKIVFMNFWETWCPPCRQEMPSMEKLYNKYKNDGLVILAIAGDREGLKVVKPFVEKRGLTFPILLDSKGRVSNTYGIFALPTTIIVGVDGIIIGKVQGGADWFTDDVQEYFESLLKKVDKS